MRYVTRSQGQVAAVLIIKIDYPLATWAKVSLLVADASSSSSSPAQPYWAHRDELFYDEERVYQPTGKISLHLSDLLSPCLPVPSEFCRDRDVEFWFDECTTGYVSPSFFSFFLLFFWW